MTKFDAPIPNWHPAYLNQLAEEWTSYERTSPSAHALPLLAPKAVLLAHPYGRETVAAQVAKADAVASDEAVIVHRSRPAAV